MTILIQLLRRESNIMVDCLSRKNWIISTEGCCISMCATAVKTLGSPIHGSVCHTSELQAPQLCVTFSQPDGGGRECIFLSLFHVIRKVINKLFSSKGVKLVLIAPFWPQRECFTDLVGLSINTPRRLPFRRDLR